MNENNYHINIVLPDDMGYYAFDTTEKVWCDIKMARFNPDEILWINYYKNDGFTLRMEHKFLKRCSISCEYTQTIVKKERRAILPDSDSIDYESN